jgi:hypothetical protein
MTDPKNKQPEAAATAAAPAAQPDPVIAELTKSVAALHAKVDDLTKGHKATAKAISAINFAEVEPSNPHEAIQRTKAEGCTLAGQELRDLAISRFPKAFSDLARANAKARAQAAKDKPAAK